MSSFGISRIGRAAAAGVMALLLAVLPACGMDTGSTGDVRGTTSEATTCEAWDDIASDAGRLVFLDGDSTTKFVFRIDGDAVTGKAAYMDCGRERLAKMVATGLRADPDGDIASVRVEDDTVIVEYDASEYAGMTAADAREECSHMTEVV